MSYTAAELLCVMAARYLRDGQTVFAGVGLPLLAVALAKRTHAPHLTMIVEGGVIGAEVVPGRLPISTNEMRLAHRATMLPPITDTFHFAQRGLIDVGFIGGAQIDRYGNVNTSVIGPYDRPRVRLPGSGGANDLASLCSETVLVTLHERRRFVEQVDFVTSPGGLPGGRARREAGLLFGGVSRVITDLGLFGFDAATGAMRLEALHPGVTVEQVQAATGFALLVAEPLPTTAPPTEHELSILRSLDAERRFLG
ncbi:MAG TPA: CoA-transferase [Chloroflexota bacterium]|nr:CoA-transferase [Chloroflexota bacterium]